MSQPADQPPGTWSEAAARASFAFFEPDNARVRWAGGFGFDPSGVSQIEVLGNVDGHEVSVHTSRTVGGMHDGSRSRVRIIRELLWSYLMNDPTQVDLPWSVTVEADDRVLTVDSHQCTFEGVRIAGDRQWIGTTKLDGLTLKVTTSSGSEIAIRPCSDPAALPETPPDTS